MPITFAKSDTEIMNCFPIMHVLRPHLDADTFLVRARQQESQGYHLVYLEENSIITSVSGFRVFDLFFSGKTLYIDDLVTHSDARGHGHGSQLLTWIINHAKEIGCNTVSLDSGYHRFDAHRFYLNHGFKLASHHFALQLDAPKNRA